MNVTKFLLPLGLLVVILLLVAYIQQRNINDARIERNNELWRRSYVTKNGELAMQVRNLKLSVDQMKDSVGKIAKNLGIKPKNIQQVTNTTLYNERTVEVRWRDSIRAGDTIRCVSYQDSVHSVHGCGDSLTIGTQIKLIAVNHKYREKWYKKKRDHTTVYSPTPGTKVVGLQVLEKEDHSWLWRLLFD